jgi:hypothetical protein
MDAAQAWIPITRDLDNQLNPNPFVAKFAEMIMLHHPDMVSPQQFIDFIGEKQVQQLSVMALKRMNKRCRKSPSSFASLALRECAAKSQGYVEKAAKGKKRLLVYIINHGTPN